MSDLNSKYAKNLLENKTCETCDFNLFCQKRNKHLYSTCLKWQKSQIADILKVVRLGYPNTIKNELINVMPMSTPEDIKYNKY